MIVKICVVLLFAGFISLSTANPTNQTNPKTFLELEGEAEEACMLNKTLYMEHAAKLVMSFSRRFNYERMYSESQNQYVAKLYCPIVCYAQQLGIVNDGGFSKDAVKWTREFVDDLYINFTGSVRPSYLDIKPHDEVKRAFESIFHVSQKSMQPLNDACSAPNEEMRGDLLITKIESWETEVRRAENLSTFTPSDEKSPVLELVLNTASTCSSKFNISSTSMAKDIIFTTMQWSKKSICHLHCMLTEMNIINGTSVNWANDIWDVDAYFYETAQKMKAAIDEAAVLLNSKCSTEFDALPDNYFVGALQEIILKQKFNE